MTMNSTVTAPNGTVWPSPANPGLDALTAAVEVLRQELSSSPEREYEVSLALHPTGCWALETRTASVEAEALPGWMAWGWKGLVRTMVPEAIAKDLLAALDAERTRSPSPSAGSRERDGLGWAFEWFWLASQTDGRDSILSAIAVVPHCAYKAQRAYARSVIKRLTRSSPRRAEYEGMVEAGARACAIVDGIGIFEFRWRDGLHFPNGPDGPEGIFPPRSRRAFRQEQIQLDWSEATVLWNEAESLTETPNYAHCARSTRMLRDLCRWHAST